MISHNTDIDIDFADRDQALDGLIYRDAVHENRGNVVKHPSGVYFQDIPLHPITDMASIEYEEAERLGYFKVDFLNQSVYRDVRDEQHLDYLLNSEPVWELLNEPTFVEQLMHIHNYHNVVKRIAPKSILDLAVVLALIRPGKKHLLYRDRESIDREIWEPTRDGYVFRKAHAISYAALIVVQMNLIVEKLSREIEDQSSDSDDFITF